ncbi:MULTISPECIES: glycosyltransferase family 10 domain-containing protein [unclassified Mucilaginibacter]|uniref:glycosyltransferase family 10 domain-containing protein n=1 Tax=unclassified Mucilaginibacter TaxID=2617802 RepID=UPI002AC9BD77|nr:MULTISPECIES: glycosyltransferase family 10 [unclassified Mucilaginibacter]MEB0260640.1 glycosyltransferase family 10 [Mucilaginibacter sp. 10I4]MEB0277475.1 glycosyltransferase family 10 [Mucilaginibacter sp. 10B2]MEB0302326.1 glycosyltransferase family 10 [Mucilaginibacter sp. 5C4]WPX24895.1 glycosyltransferase family 10 [Mucilaginibacter sp. 5C4]
MPKTIRIKFQNGVDKQIALHDILNELNDDFIFEESETPDFILFGPYGNNIPPVGNYTRIGYYCENIQPDMEACEWAFGVPREEIVNSPRYKRIQWHGLNPQVLVKPANIDVEGILKEKKNFCNFLYSHKVPYREEFFRQLSKYKKVDAPGRSMNNMASIDSLYSGDIWQRKRQFLSSYKFTIAFENYVYPGYQTEKLYDAMQANSLPIYCGDPNIGDIFNTASFINTADFVKTNNSAFVNWLQQKSQPNFKDILPSYHKGPQYRIRRKLKTIGRELKMHYQFQKLDFTPLIDRIIELDNDDDKYICTLQQPWFINNQPPVNASLKNHWIKIFNSRI